MSGFYHKLLFRLRNMLPKYLEEMKETGKLPSGIPSPLEGAAETLHRISEVILTPSYIEDIKPGHWIVTSRGDTVLRGTKHGANEDDLCALNRAIYV